MIGYKRELQLSNQKIIGKGVIFHIAPSNVAVNYAYSLVTGLITGNINIVRVPSKDFEQIDIINRSLSEGLKRHPGLSDYICLIRYGHDKKINDCLSLVADIRIVWGGDETIKALRLSQMKPRSTEVVFADRYSFAIIDSDCYNKSNDKDRIIKHFYNDTYLTDQNACSSPKLIVWTGHSIESSKSDFWNRVHSLVKCEYNYQQIIGIEKLIKICIVATKILGSKLIKTEDNFIIRMSVPNIDDADIQSCFGNLGFFLEYDAKTLDEIIPLCNNSKCQTITYVGNAEMFDCITKSGCRGVDRIVPFGKSMDFDLIWDGYNLVSLLTRAVVIRH